MKCMWCDNEAVRKTYRTIDDTTGSSRECLDCIGLDTNHLLKREQRRKRK